MKNERDRKFVETAALGQVRLEYLAAPRPTMVAMKALKMQVSFALAVLLGAAGPELAAESSGSPPPTVIVDIHALGFEALQALKGSPDVRWSAEFGNELLLGVDPATLDDWLAKPRVRAGLGTMQPDEILVRDHVCAHQAVQPALGVVGGYEILREPPMVVRYAQRNGLQAQPLPESRVFAREIANEEIQRAARGAEPAVAAIVARVDAERWFTTMSELAAINRNSFSPALVTARDYIHTQFIAAQLAPETFSFSLANLTNCGTTAPPPITITNPIGRKRGETLPDEWIVVGAHYDSRNSARCDGTVNPQPGANDNASGCAGVMELARVFANVPTARSILFMCYSGEEQGLVGSRRYVEALQANGDIAKVKHMINLDMIGYAQTTTLSARIDTNLANQFLLTDYAAAAATYAPELSLISSTNAGAGSDHWWFLQAGVPAMFTWENGASIYPHYHLATDIPANMTRARPLAGGILKMDAAVLAGQAGLIEFADGFANGFE